jgi:large subunit ribosomal protein L21
LGLGSRTAYRRPRRTEIYAVIRSGGKQYRVERDQLLDVDLIKGDVGSTVELNEVLLVANNGDVKVGTPTIEGAVVEAEIVEHGRDKKLRVFKYKAKTRYRRRIGHRTRYTRLAIKRILQDGKETVAAEEKPKAKRPARRAKKAEKVQAKAEETAVEAAGEVEPTAAEAAPEAEAKPKRATRRKATAEAAPEAEAKPKRATRRTTQRKTKTSAEAPAQAEASTDDEPKKPARRRSTTSKTEDKPARATRRRTTKPKAEAPEEKTDEEPGG